MATFWTVFHFVWPIVAGILIADLARDVRNLKRQVAAYQRIVATFTTPSGGIVEFPGTVTAEQAEEFKRRWLEAVNGPDAYKAEVLHPCICPGIDVTVPGGPLRYLPGERDPKCQAHDRKVER